MSGGRWAAAGGAMGGRIAPEDFPALPGVHPSRVCQRQSYVQKLDLSAVLYLMSCGICFVSHTGLSALQNTARKCYVVQ